jgi:tRNA A37 threonylcarbamoyltransferase TsaD
MIHSEEIATCFNPCIGKLIEGTRRQMAKDDHPADVRGLLLETPSNPLTKISQTIVLGGGLFANQYVRKAMEKTFHSVRILMPSSE